MRFSQKLALVATTAVICTAACVMGSVLRSTAAAALPAERHYEMVSPPFKNGYGVLPHFTHILAALDGESVEFSSDGVFDEAPSGFSGTDVDYVAARGADEWATQPVLAPATLLAGTLAGDVTSSLNRVLEIGEPGSSKENVALEQDVLTHATGTPDVAADWESGVTMTLANPANTSIVPVYLTSDNELCRSVVSAGGTEALLPEALGGERNIYELALGCNGQLKSIKLVALDNKGDLMRLSCASEFGGTNYERATNVYNAMSADASEIFFTTCLSGSGEAKVELPHQLFVRLAGTKTLEVSRPVGEACEAGGVAGEVPCDGAELRASADFQGASEDGSTVYFSAPATPGHPLVPGDSDESDNLYMARIGCSAVNPGCAPSERVVISLVEASHDPRSGQAAEVMGVARVSPDGSRSYFVAGGDLLSVSEQGTLEGEGRPVPEVGAANLYEFDRNAGIEFIGELCSGRLTSGTAGDTKCPSSQSDESLWVPNGGSPAQTGAGDGRYLVFTTNAQLTPDDVNEAGDVYRFDAATGRLTRVSQGENGADDNGNRQTLGAGGEVLGASIALGLVSGRNWSEHEMGSRAISEDGSRIVFLSAEPLSNAATNGLLNVYEWREGGGRGEGAVSLLSGGTSEKPSAEPIISPSGRDVFFVTSQGLEPQDTDGLNDVYDARTGAGFPPVSTPKQACSGDACQGPLTNPAPVLVPGSAVETPGENLALPVSLKNKAARKPVKCRKGYRKKKGRCVKVAAKRPKRGGRGR